MTYYYGLSTGCTHAGSNQLHPLPSATKVCLDMAEQ